MMTTVSNRLLTIGVLWGVLLAAAPTLVMTRPYRLSGFLVATLVCAGLSGCVGTLAAGRRAARRKESGWVLAGLGTGFFKGLVSVALSARLIWALLSFNLAGLPLQV